MDLSLGLVGWVDCDVDVDVIFRKRCFRSGILTYFVVNVSIVLFLCSLYFMTPLCYGGFLVLLKGDCLEFLGPLVILRTFP